MKEYLAQKIGQPIAILCARYWYRGIVADVKDNYVVLSNPFAVEVTGISTRTQPETEDAIPSDLCISYDAVEIVCQPIWAFFGYDVAKKGG